MQHTAFPEAISNGPPDSKGLFIPDGCAIARFRVAPRRQVFRSRECLEGGRPRTVFRGGLAEMIDGQRIVATQSTVASSLHGDMVTAGDRQNPGDFFRPLPPPRVHYHDLFAIRRS